MAHDRGDVKPLNRQPGSQVSADELQKLLRAKRESITQTVEEIKMSMNSGFQDSKNKMKETLDWRHQVQHYPLAAVAGALAVGFLAGQLISRAMSHEGHRISRRRSRISSPSMSATGGTFGAGTSLASESRSSSFATGRPHREHRERHFVPPAVKSKFKSRMEEVLTELSDNLMTEISRVGRDVIVPTLMSSLTNAITHQRSSGTSRSGGEDWREYSSKSTTESFGTTAAGGPISSGEDKGPGNRFQGRGI